MLLDLLWDDSLLQALRRWHYLQPIGKRMEAGELK
jgi:hypothetical protein